METLVPLGVPCHRIGGHQIAGPTQFVVMVVVVVVGTTASSRARCPPTATDPFTTTFFIIAFFVSDVFPHFPHL